MNSSFIDPPDLVVSSMFGMRGGVWYFFRLSTDLDRRLIETSQNCDRISRTLTCDVVDSVLVHHL